jgi:Enoyl-CoA hydratase/carnithine racemase
MPELDLEKKNEVFVVTLDNPSTGNAFNTLSLSAHREILSELETVKDNSAVVITSSNPKSWCVGLDFDWINEQRSKN